MTETTSTRVATLTAMLPITAAATLAGSAGYAETVITVFDGLTIETGNVGFDVDGDLSSDFFLDVRSDPDKGQMFSARKGSGARIFKDGSFAKEFFAGDTVGASSGLSGSFISLFKQSVGPLGGGVGDSMFVGFFLSALDIPTVAAFEVEDENGPPPAPIVNYGWAEIERGSLTLLRVGFDNTGAAAVIPDAAPPVVPVPASLLLLATGAAGLGALRRRQKAAA